MRAGLDPRTRLLRWSLFLTIVGMVLAVTGADSLDAVATWFRAEYPRLPWYVVRVTGWLAYLGLTVSVIYGLLLSTGILDAIAHRTVSFTLHQDLSGAGLALALVHAAVLMIDRSVPFTPADIVVPLIGPYRPVWVAFGQLALALTVIVVASFYVRRQMGQVNWRRLHYVSFVAYLAMTVHGLMAGTDSATIWAQAVIGGSLALVGALSAVRVGSALAGRDTGRERGPTGS